MVSTGYGSCSGRLGGMSPRAGLRLSYLLFSRRCRSCSFVPLSVRSWQVTPSGLASSAAERHGRQARGENVPLHAVGGSSKASATRYGPGGAAIIVDAVTDDPGPHGRAGARHLPRARWQSGRAGSVSYCSTRRAHDISARHGRERLMQVALEAGAEDVVQGADTSIEVLADPVEFETVRAILTDSGFVPTTAEVTQRASIATPLVGQAAELMVHCSKPGRSGRRTGRLFRMSRYRTRSWRAFDARTRVESAAVMARAAPRCRSRAAVTPLNVRILGLDPGSRRTGFGVIECRGSDYVHVAHGCLNVGGARCRGAAASDFRWAAGAHRRASARARLPSSACSSTATSKAR